MRQPVLEGGAVRLRAFHPDDVDALLRAVEDPAVAVLLDLEPGDREAAAAHVARQRLRAERDVGCSWAVADASDDRLVGHAGIWFRDAAPDGRTGFIEADHGRASIGYWTAPEARGRGVAAAALRTVSAWAMEQRGIERLELFIDVDNAASRRTAESAGYRLEGVLRSRQPIGGIRRDMAVDGLLPTNPR